MQGFPLAMRPELEVAVAIAVVLAGTVLLVVLLAWARRRLLPRDENDARPGGFTLSDLRRLHRDGKMSDEEFERAKAQLVALAHRSLKSPAEAPGGPRSEPKNPMNPPAVD